MIVETSLGVEAREVPFKDDSVTVDVLVPCLSLGAQGFQVGDSAFAQTLPGKQADLDFGLIEPTGMLGSVMDGESLPKSLGSLDAEMAVQRFAAMGIEVVQNQVDGARTWKAIGQPLNHPSELRRFAIGRRMSEVPPSLGLDCAKDVRPSTPLVFIIPLG